LQQRHGLADMTAERSLRVKIRAEIQTLARVQMRTGISISTRRGNDALPVNVECSENACDFENES
jgi:hypothetical protein